MTERMQTVAETAAYIRDAERLLAMAERANLSKAEVNSLAKAVKQLAENYGG